MPFKAYIARQSTDWGGKWSRKFLPAQLRQALRTKLNLKPFDLSPKILQPHKLISNYSGVDSSLINEIYHKYKRDLHPKLADDQFDMRFLRATMFLAPFITSNINSKKLRALEIGSGHGAKALSLSHFFSEYVGVELVKNLVDYSKQAARIFGAKNLHFYHDSAASLENFLYRENRKFDFIILYAVLEHLTPEEKISTLKVCWEYLEDDGYLFVGETPNRMLPLDLHSTKLLYFQQMQLDMWQYCYQQSLNNDWKKHHKLAFERDEFSQTAYRRGVHVGHQEFELSLGMPMEEFPKYIITDNYSTMLLNQYVYSPLEYLKLMEFKQFEGFRGRKDVEYRRFPDFFSRYYIEFLLQKTKLKRPVEDVHVGMLVSHGSLLGTKLFQNLTLSRSESVKINANDIGDIREKSIKSLNFAIEIINPSNGGVIRLSSSNGSIIGEFDPKSMMQCISQYRKSIVFEIGTIRGTDFPLMISCIYKAVTIGHIFFRSLS